MAFSLSCMVCIATYLLFTAPGGEEGLVCCFDLWEGKGGGRKEEI